MFDDRLERFFLEHSSQLFICALAVTGCAGRAEDAVQEAFAHLFRLRREPRNLKAYVFRSVRNAAVDQLRRLPPDQQGVPETLFDSADAPDQAAVENEFKRDAARAIQSLTDDHRETVVGHLYAGLTFREIAMAREVFVNTVASWYRRGIGKLRRLLEKHDERV